MAPLEPKDRGPAVIDTSSFQRGFIGFGAFTLVGLGLVYVVTNEGNPIDMVRNLSAGYFVLAALAMVLDLLLGGLRHHIYLRKLVPGSSVWLPIRADLVGRFTGAMTPSQTGGGPGQVFVLYRGGIPLPAILAVLMINLLATMIFFVLVAGSATWLVGDQVSSSMVRGLIRWGFSAVVVVIGFLALSLTRPDLAVRPIEALARRLSGRTSRWAQGLRRVSDLLVASADQYQANCVRCIREWPILPVVSVFLTVVLYLNKFTMAWLVVRGFGVDGSYTLTLAVQAVYHLILYVAPTPGGSGIGEVTASALMAVVLPSALLLPFAVAYRFFLTYLPTLIGAALLGLELRARPAERPSIPVAATAPVALMIALALGVPTLAAAAPVVPTPSGFTQEAPGEIPDITVLDEAELETSLRQALADGIAATTKIDSVEALDRAVALGGEWVRVAPADAEAHYLYSVALGERLGLHGTRTKIRMAEQCWSEAEYALVLDPDHAGAHHVMGRLHAAAMRLGRVARFVARRLLGAKTLESASWEMAEHHFGRARDLEPDNPRHWMELGVLYIDTDRPDQARTAFRRSIEAPQREASDHAAAERAATLLGEIDCPKCS